ncbi:hypothetical protein GCM10022197_27610 [Microlunatus spumicola]|uniref:Uncharacterized protein n=1 Tax=Microlunatus spumicola TaxID=81499 RepID=A0ABP6XMW9_9ACTN
MTPTASPHPPPEPATVLRAPGLVLHIDADGTVTSAGAPAAALPWLGACGELTVTGVDGPLALGAPRVGVDVDEVEVARSGGGLTTVVRHSVEQGWAVRVVLANETDAELALPEVRLGWRAAPGTVVTALAAGARAAYAVQAEDGEGPVLLGSLRAGAQHGVDAGGLLLGPVVLAPHHRWAVAWRWEVVPDARRAFVAELPRTTWLERDQTAVLRGGPDVAVVAPGLEVVPEDDRVEVLADEPGAYRVELRSARGTTALPLTWAPDLDDLVDVAAAALLVGPTTPAGTVRLDGAAAGLVLQDALAHRSGDDPDSVGDALELLAGTLADALDDGAADEGAVPTTLALLAREADRTGDTALLDVATRHLLATTAAVPGLGLAGAGIALARVRSGRPVTEVVAHLADLRAAAADPTGRDVAGLELALLLRPRDAEAGPEVLAGLRRLGASVGAGLPGRVVPPVAPDVLAHTSTVLGLVDEPTGQRLQRVWGVTASELARRSAAEVRARLADGVAGGTRDPADRRALAALVLGRR